MEVYIVNEVSWRMERKEITRGYIKIKQKKKRGGKKKNMWRLSNFYNFVKPNYGKLIKTFTSTSMETVSRVLGKDKKEDKEGESRKIRRKSGLTEVSSILV